jgi:CRP/FNR family transcriptional regulator, cyclic AMP receptor protein
MIEPSHMDPFAAATVGQLDRKKQASPKREVLAGHPLFATLDDRDIDQIIDYSRIAHFSKGATIFTAGEPGSGLLAVMSGAVRITGHSAEGKEIVYNTIHAGEVFGEIALLDGRQRTANATAMTECEILSLDRRDFIPFLKQNPEIGLTLLSVLCERLRRTSDHVEDVLFLDVAGRLAKTVLRLSTPDQTGKRRVRATQKEMGQMIGLSRESTNKQLQNWVRNKWVTVEKGGLIVKNAAALEKFAMENL